MTCSKCGQTLPENGVCYNCLKNQIDAKRYGRGSGIIPAYKKYGSQRIFPRKRDLGSRKTTTAKQRRSPRRGRSHPAGEAQLPEQPLQGASLAHQRRGVNRFLEAVYGRPMLISDMLKRRRFDDSQIETVKDHAAKYLTLLHTTLNSRWHRILTPRQTVVVAHFYSFNGQAPRDMDYLAQKLEMSTEYFKDNLNSALAKLRQPHGKKHLDRTIYNTAGRLLASSGAPSAADCE